MFAIPLVLAETALFTHHFWSGLLLIVAIIAGVAAGLAFLNYYYNIGEMTVFDFHEKKIFYGRCRRFQPENTGTMKSVSFSEVDHLSIALFKIGHDVSYKHGSRAVAEEYIGLLAVKSNGDVIPLCRATQHNLPRLLALLPDLAEKMGHLVITHFRAILQHGVSFLLLQRTLFFACSPVQPVDFLRSSSV